MVKFEGIKNKLAKFKWIGVEWFRVERAKTKLRSRDAYHST